MKKIYSLLALLLLFSCSKSPEEEYQKTLHNFRESSTGSTELLEALIRRRGGTIHDENKLRADVSLPYSLEGRKITLHGAGGIVEYTLPDRVAFHGAAVTENAGYIAAGRYLLIYSDSSSFDRAVKFPGGGEVLAVNLLPSGVLVLAGRKLYRLQDPSGEPEAIVDKELPTPVKKSYSGFLTTSGDLSAVVLGFAGRYHVSVIDWKKKKLMAEKISAAGSSCYLDGKRVFYVSGGSGAWKVSRFNVGTKNKKIISTLSNIVTIALFRDGFAVESEKGIFLHDYEKNRVFLPIEAMLQGRCGDRMLLILEKEKSALVSFENFRKDLMELRNMMPALFKTSASR